MLITNMLRKDLIMVKIKEPFIAQRACEELVSCIIMGIIKLEYFNL